MMTQRKYLLPYLALLLCLASCSFKNIALDQMADAIADQGSVMASDDDPDLIRDAAPVSLKLMDSLLAQRADHEALLTAATRAYTQYAYAFIQLPADEIEAKDVKRAYQMRERARKLYQRAISYGLRGLNLKNPDLRVKLQTDGPKALDVFTADDVDLLYWTGAAWGAWIALSVDNTDAIADLPLVINLMDRALELNEGFDAGALHTLMIAMEASKGDKPQVAAKRAQPHLDRAVQLSQHLKLGPYVSMAEKIAVPLQDQKLFESLLSQALAIPIESRPEWRLENTLMQHRAQWLLEQTKTYFLE